MKNGELFLPSNPEEKYVYTADGSFINEGVLPSSTS